MASSGKSKQLGLSLWEPSDRPERMDFRQDNEQLEQLVGGHLSSSFLHLTEKEKNYLGLPFSLVHYVGTGKEELGRYVTIPMKAILILCSSHGPSEIDSNGVEHVYWDFWAEKSYGDMVNAGGGGVGYVSNYLISYSKTIGNRVFHLNDKDLRYVAIMLPKVN